MAAVSIGHANVSRAEGPAILWSAPSECPTEQTLRERLSIAIGRPPPSLETSVLFDARVEQQSGAYRATLTVQRQGVLGHRILVDSDCDRLTTAIAVSLALALSTTADTTFGSGARNPGLSTAPTANPFPAFAPTNVEPATSPAAPSPEPWAPTHDPPSTALVPDEDADGAAGPVAPYARPTVSKARSEQGPWLSRVVWHAGLWGLVDARSLPQSGPGATLGLGAGLGRVVTELRATFLARRTSSDGRGRFVLAAASADVCFRPLAGLHGFLGGCASFEAGRLSGDGTSVTHFSRAVVWLAPGIRLSGGYRLGNSPLLLMGAIAALAPLTRPGFILNDDERDVVHRPGALVGRFELGALFEFR